MRLIILNERPSYVPFQARLYIFNTMADSTPADLLLTVKDIQDEAEKKLPQLYRCMYIPDIKHY